MKRIKKATLLMTRSIAYRYNFLRLYYWAEEELLELQSVSLMPRFYYRWLFQTAMRLVEYHRFQRLADKAIHTIPYHIRFEVA
jgi:hypothetical protein